MVDTITYKRRARTLGFLSTLLLIGSLVVILLLIILHTPIPPYPEGGGGQGDGIELNLGFSDAGMGNNQQELAFERALKETMGAESDMIRQALARLSPENRLTEGILWLKSNVPETAAKVLEIARTHLHHHHSTQLSPNFVPQMRECVMP